MIGRELGFRIAVGCLCLTVLGFLTGMVVERVRFDSSAPPCCSILAATQKRLHTHLMGFERQTKFPRRRDDR
jgi:hypothetical protein